MNIARLIETQLPSQYLKLIKLAGNLASQIGQNPYLVGGVVRDMLLGRPNLDLDIVVEGDAVGLAERLGQSVNGKVVVHSRFGTASVKSDSISLDIVTARSEKYPRPGALPAVKPGSIEDDLFRRDFTINAIAARIDARRFGDVVDPYRGKRDLEGKLIRTLHDKSFIDDPTRIWRAVRYEQRLEFRLEEEAERLLRRDVVMMDRVSGDRIRHEIERILREERPEKSFSRAEELGALRQLDPALPGNSWLAGRFGMVREAVVDLRSLNRVYLALLVWKLDEESLDRFMQRLRFGRETARTLREIAELKRVLPVLDQRHFAPGQTYELLEPFTIQSVTAAMFAVESVTVRNRLRAFLFEYRRARPQLDGDDLRRMGIPAGPDLGLLLRELKKARLDGRVSTREDEVELVRGWFNRSRHER
ncbi:MAG: CCA tRNA nucleotidyltransferase [Dehalococcoidia bacterium]|nr:CCA tRNA nucleotidyltransferase [Dehalococcoidia bacterium]